MTNQQSALILECTALIGQMFVRQNLFHEEFLFVLILALYLDRLYNPLT